MKNSSCSLRFQLTAGRWCIILLLIISNDIKQYTTVKERDKNYVTASNGADCDAQHGYKLNSHELNTQMLMI